MTRAAAGARRRAREVAFRIAYQVDVTRDGYAQVWGIRREEERLNPDQVALVEDVVDVLERRVAEVDEHLQRAAEHWALARLSATDRSVLRAAAAELMGRPGTPARVVLDEAIDIAKRYGSEESGRFVNGVLDRVARALRPKEF
jgi:N utilization substance protein B